MTPEFRKEILDRFEDNATNYFDTEQNVRAGMQLQRDAWNDAILAVVEHINKKGLVQVDDFNHFILRREFNPH